MWSQRRTCGVCGRRGGVEEPARVGEIPRTPSDIAVAAADVPVLEVMPALLLMVMASQAEHLKQSLRRVRGSEPVVGRCDLRKREKHWSNDADVRKAGHLRLLLLPMLTP